VSLLPNKTLSIVLGASALRLDRCPGGLQRLRALWRPGPDRAVQARPSGGHWLQLSMPETQWFTEQGALALFAQALASDAAAGVQRVEVVLEDFWVHHTLLRGDFRRLRARELEEVVQAWFADTFDLEAGALACRWTVQPGGRFLFASAIPRSLLEGLLAASAAAAVKITRLTPRLPFLLNQVRGQLEGRSSMLVVVADAVLQTVMGDGRHWMAYDAQRLFPGDHANAARLVAIAENLFERSAVPEPEACTVYWCGHLPTPAPVMPRFAGLIVLPALATGEGQP
jgi:hypothetical protein